MHKIGANGINGTFYDKNGSVMILINKGKILGANAWNNGWNRPKRPLIYFTKDGILKNCKVKSVNYLPDDVKNIVWAVGGGSLPFDKNEAWGNDIIRKAERTALAIKNNYVYMIATKERLSLYEFFDKIQSAIKPDKAIFLDGGGSTQMFYNESIITSNRKVDNGIFIL